MARAKSWYKDFIGKRVTIRDKNGVLYKGRFLGFVNQRIFLQDVKVLKNNKNRDFSLLTLEVHSLHCLYSSSEKITRLISFKPG